MSVLVLLLGCRAGRLGALPPVVGTPTEQAQAWVDRLPMVGWVDEEEGAILPLVALDGSFPLKNGTLYMYLGSAPWFGDGDNHPQVVVYRNQVMPFTEMVADIVVRHQVPPELAFRLGLQILDHNGCFEHDQGYLILDMLIYQQQADPSIEEAWIIAGHGGGDRSAYRIGSIPLYEVIGMMVEAGHTHPDLLMLASCNPDNTAPIRDQLAALGCYPQRLGWSPNGFSSTNIQFGQARPWLLTEPALLTRRQDAQFGFDMHRFTPHGIILGVEEWVLFRCAIEPVVPVAVTRASCRTAAVVLWLAGLSRSSATQVWAAGDRLTTPVRVNRSNYEWREH